MATASIASAAQNTGPGNIEAILKEIEQNNTSLQALSEQAGADRLATRTGITLPAPEVEAGFLKGRPNAIGNRTDIAVSQGFDIATVSGARLRQARRQERLIGLQTASERTKILLEAKLCCIELIYYNRLAQELEIRLQHAQTLADAYSHRLESGDASRLETGRAQLNLSMVRGEMARVEIERSSLRAELQRLNGGREITLDDTGFPPVSLPGDFESWLADAGRRDPGIEYARRDLEVSQRGVGLAQTERLPDFSVGYMRERTLGQRYEGVTVGVSLPLWGSRNGVKHAKAALAASQARERDTNVQFAEQMKNLYLRVSALEKAATEYRRALAEADNTDLLKKALDAGEISLPDYTVVMGIYYDMVDMALEAERDFQSACAKLTAMEL